MSMNLLKKIYFFTYLTLICKYIYILYDFCRKEFRNLFCKKLLCHPELVSGSSCSFDLYGS